MAKCVGLTMRKRHGNKKIDARDIDIWLRVQSIVYFRVNEQSIFNRIYRNIFRLRWIERQFCRDSPLATPTKCEARRKTEKELILFFCPFEAIPIQFYLVIILYRFESKATHGLRATRTQPRSTYIIIIDIGFYGEQLLWWRRIPIDSKMFPHFCRCSMFNCLFFVHRMDSNKNILECREQLPLIGTQLYISISLCQIAIIIINKKKVKKKRCKTVLIDMINLLFIIWSKRIQNIAIHLGDSHNWNYTKYLILTYWNLSRPTGIFNIE